MINGTWAFGMYRFAILPEIEIQSNESHYYFKSVNSSIICNEQDFVSIFDINNDSLVDILVGSKIYQNNGNFSFSDVTNEYGIKDTVHNSCVVDIDNDGLQDILLFKTIDTNNLSSLILYKNVKNKLDRIELPISGVLAPISFLVSDINADGYADIIVTQSPDSNGLTRDIILVNNKNLSFEKLYLEVHNSIDSSINRMCAVADLNNDNLLDLYFGSGRSNDNIIINRGNLLFDEINLNEILPADIIENNNRTSTDETDVSILGNRLLLVSRKKTLENHPINSLILEKKGSNKFTYSLTKLKYQELQTGGCFIDVNNDGLDDLIITSGFNCRISDLYIRKNQDELSYSSLYSGFQYGLGKDVIASDLNNDGKEDLVTVLDNHLIIYCNQYTQVEQENNYLKLSPTISEVMTATHVFILDSEFVFKNISKNGIRLQKADYLTIGIGSNKHIDSIHVYSSDNKLYVVKDLNANSTLGVDKFELKNPATEMKFTVIPNPFSTNTQIKVYNIINGIDRINIINIKGEIVRNLLSTKSSYFSEIDWDGKDDAGNEVAAGAYLVVISTRDKTITGKIIKR